MKRPLEILLSLLGLLLLSPLFLAAVLLIKLDTPGPVFYRARRIGRGGRPFELVKFRSMVDGAGRLGPGITVAGDERITRSGRWLRRAKVDELPQLFNVLKGEMSLVGPRPEDPRYVALYSAEQRRVLSVRPGITSPASIRYRSEEALLAGTDWERVYTGRILPDKLQIELAYLARRTFWSDLAVLWQTALALLERP